MVCVLWCVCGVCGVCGVVCVCGVCVVVCVVCVCVLWCVAVCTHILLVLVMTAQLITPHRYDIGSINPLLAWYSVYKEWVRACEGWVLCSLGHPAELQMSITLAISSYVVRASPIRDGLVI